MVLHFVECSFQDLQWPVQVEIVKGVPQGRHDLFQGRYEEEYGVMGGKNEVDLYDIDNKVVQTPQQIHRRICELHIVVFQ